MPSAHFNVSLGIHIIGVYQNNTLPLCRTRNKRLVRLINELESTEDCSKSNTPITYPIKNSTNEKIKNPIIFFEIHPNEKIPEWEQQAYKKNIMEITRKTGKPRKSWIGEEFTRMGLVECSRAALEIVYYGEEWPQTSLVGDRRCILRHWIVQCVGPKLPG